MKFDGYRSDKVKAEYDPSAGLISREETLTAFADYVGSGMSMNDLISRQAAIEAVKKHYKEDNVLVLKPESSQEDSLEKD